MSFFDETSICGECGALTETSFEQDAGLCTSCLHLDENGQDYGICEHCGESMDPAALYPCFCSPDAPATMQLCGACDGGGNAEPDGFCTRCNGSGSVKKYTNPSDEDY